MIGQNASFKLAQAAWRADYPGTRDAWILAAQELRPSMGGYCYFVQQFILQGNYPVIPPEPPAPSGYDLSYEDYALHTALTVMGAVDYRGKIPPARMVEIDPRWPFYYFQKRYWKNRLTVFTPRDVDYSSMWGAHWELTRQGVAAWQALSPSEKLTWGEDPEAARRGIAGYHLFMSRYFKGEI